MGHQPQSNHTAQIRRVAEQRRQLAIVKLQKLLQHEAGKELWLGKLLGAKLMRVVVQRARAHEIGHLQHLPRALARRAHHSVLRTKAS